MAARKTPKPEDTTKQAEDKEPINLDSRRKRSAPKTDPPPIVASASDEPTWSERATATAAKNLTAINTMTGEDGIERRTIRGWESTARIKVIDPDGFDRSDPQLFERFFTREEFDQGVAKSTVKPYGEKPPRRRGSKVTVDAEGSVLKTEPEYERVDEDRPPASIHYTIPSDAQLDGEYTQAPELAALVDKLIAKHKLTIAGKYTIDVLWRDKGGSSRRKPVLGKITKVSGQAKYYSQYRPGGNDAPVDLTIWLAADHLREMGATIDTINAALFNKLLQISETDTPDETPQLCLVGPEFEGFGREIEVFGPWTAGLRVAQRKMPPAVQMRMDFDSQPDETAPPPDEAPPLGDSDIRVAHQAPNRAELIARIDAQPKQTPYLTIRCPSGDDAGVVLRKATVPTDDLPCPCERDTCWLILYTEPLREVEQELQMAGIPVTTPGGSSAAFL